MAWARLALPTLGYARNANAGRKAGWIDVHDRRQPQQITADLHQHLRILLLAPWVAAEILAGTNCIGLTKIVAATLSARRFASSINAMCPACSAPMVGTNASVPRAIRRARASILHWCERLHAAGPSVKPVNGAAFRCRGEKDQA